MKSYRIISFFYMLMIGACSPDKTKTNSKTASSNLSSDKQLVSDRNMKIDVDLLSASGAYSVKVSRGCDRSGAPYDVAILLRNNSSSSGYLWRKKILAMHGRIPNGFLYIKEANDAGVVVVADGSETLYSASCGDIIHKRRKLPKTD